MKKILILYAAYGGGHLSAAKSIKEYIDANYTNVETQIVDCVKYVDRILDKLTTEAYKEMAKKAPWMWKRMYNNAQKGAFSKISNAANYFMAKKISKLFKEFNPDIVISTHPFSSQMTTILKKKRIIDCKLATVMTDFAPHNQWLINIDYVDYLFVSNDNMKELIVKSTSIDKNKIYVTGIPISSRFMETFNKEKIYEEFTLSPDKKTILFFGGGEYGLGKSRTIEIFEALAKSNYNIQVVAIAGKNEKLKESFEEIVKLNLKRGNIKVLPFTNKVPELMSISDLVITKPGGLTISESLVSKLPIIIINPIPGQEEENAEFLENYGAAIWIRKNSNPKEILDSVINNEEKLNTMKQNSINLSKKNSTADICKIVLE